MLDNTNNRATKKLDDKQIINQITETSNKHKVNGIHIYKIYKKALSPNNNRNALFTCIQQDSSWIHATPVSNVLFLFGPR